MNYKIIQDIDRVKEFIDFLPDLKDGEKYYCTLFARKKYDTFNILKADKNQLKRFVSDKEHLLHKIKQLEVEYGAYTFDGKPIPQETLALYITPNPRSTHKAALATMSDMLNKIKKGELINNPHSISLNNLQTESSRRYFFDIDVDVNPGFILDIDTLCSWLDTIISKYTIVKTRGGYHILVHLDELNPQQRKTWYNQIANYKSDTFNVMMNSDNLLPVPGCTQGGYTPTLIKNLK